jgi:hypothetical protein
MIVAVIATDCLHIKFKGICTSAQTQRRYSTLIVYLSLNFNRSTSPRHELEHLRLDESSIDLKLLSTPGCRKFDGYARTNEDNLTPRYVEGISSPL